MNSSIGLITIYHKMGVKDYGKILNVAAG